MLSENPKVSVIIPAYNVEKYIGKAIGSVLNQTYTNLELIVVNDGSTDHTKSEIEKYCDLHKVIVLNQENQGVSASRNNGLKIAQGKWCVFLDGDDFLEPQLIELLVKEAEQFCANTGKENILIGTNCNFVNEAGELCTNRITKANESVEDTVIDAHQALCETGTSKYILQSVWCKMFRMETIKSNAIKFNESYPNGEDGLFVFEYLCNAEAFVFVSRKEWNILIREGSVTRAGFKETLNSAIPAIEQMIRMAPDEEILICLRRYLLERTVSLECSYIVSGSQKRKLMDHYRSVIRENKDNSGKHSWKKTALYNIMLYFPESIIRILLKIKGRL